MVIVEIGQCQELLEPLLIGEKLIQDSVTLRQCGDIDHETPRNGENGHQLPDADAWGARQLVEYPPRKQSSSGKAHKKNFYTAQETSRTGDSDRCTGVLAESPIQSARGRPFGTFQFYGFATVQGVEQQGAKLVLLLVHSVEVLSPPSDYPVSYVKVSSAERRDRKENACSTQVNESTTDDQ